MVLGVIYSLAGGWRSLLLLLLVVCLPAGLSVCLFVLLTGCTHAFHHCCLSICLYSHRLSLLLPVYSCFCLYTRTGCHLCLLAFLSLYLHHSYSPLLSLPPVHVSVFLFTPFANSASFCPCFCLYTRTVRHLCLLSFLSLSTHTIRTLRYCSVLLSMFLSFFSHRPSVFQSSSTHT